MAHSYYSQRAGLGPHPNGLPLRDIVDLFVRAYNLLRCDGYFDEAFGFVCADAGQIPGTVRDPELEILLAIRKKNLWPIELFETGYSEDDLFDVIEFLFQHVSKPIKGTVHTWNECGMHWETFDGKAGRKEFCDRVNSLLSHYERPFELSPNGEVLRKPDAGFEPILTAELPLSDANVVDRVDASVLRFRRHGSTVEDRRQAVRDLADVLEYLRPKIKAYLTSKDESDLFNIANNFGIRHHNEKQKTMYDSALWLNWMFYFFLSTIHVLTRKMNQAKATNRAGEE